MSKVYFDVEQVEKNLRQMRAELFPNVIANAKSERERLHFLIQDRFFDATILVRRIHVELINEEQPSDLVARATGAAVGNMAVSFLLNVDDPESALKEFFSGLSAALSTIIDEPVENGFVKSSTVHGQNCGSA